MQFVDTVNVLFVKDVGFIFVYILMLFVNVATGCSVVQFDYRSNQTMIYKIDTCCFLARCSALLG